MRKLTTGYYTPTENFKAITEHVAVMDATDNRLIAITGQTGDQESEADARLFAEAENLLHACKSLVFLLEGDSGTGATYWQSFPQYQFAKKTIAQAEQPTNII